MTKISIIILTFNSRRVITSCLDSVLAQSYHDFEVINIDNGSKDGTAGFIKEKYPQVILVENKENLGAAKARNQGIEISKGRLILALDCDVVLEKGFLEKAAVFEEKLEKSVGMFQPKVLNPDKKTIYSCGIYLSKLRRFYDIGRGKIDNGQFDSPEYIFGICSAAAFYKRQMLEELKEKTGYFDERFFFLVEDVDLSWRAQRKGWKAVYCPEAVCCHLGDSSGTPGKIRQYFCFRNRYYSIIKNDSFRNVFATLLFLISYDFPRLFYLLFNNRYALKAIRKTFGFIKTELSKKTA